MKKRMLQKIMAFILLITLTMVNFIFVGINVVSAVEEVVQEVQEKNTSHKNVEFMAYFKDEGGKKISNSSAKTDATDLKLYLNIAVKQEGYFNGKISLKNSNFKFNKDKETANDYVSEITEDTVVLNQLNAGDSTEIELNIELLKDVEYDVSFLNKETVLELTGTYRDSKQKDISVSGTRNIKLQLVSPYDEKTTEATLNQQIITNKVLQYQGEHRVVQTKIELGLNDNLYPIKSSKIELMAPTLKGKYPSNVYVQTPEKLSINGEDMENGANSSYDASTGKVTITAENAEKEGKIVWNKSGKDSYIVTYVFDGTETIEDQKLVANAEMTLYDENKTVIKSNNETALSSKEVDSVVNIKVTGNENEIYKGKLQEGIDREITQNIDIQVNLENIAEKISIQEDFSKMNLPNVYTKNVTLNIDNLTNILGDNGNISIINKETNTVLTTISKDTAYDEQKNVIYTLPDNVKEIVIQTTKPEKTGTLTISTTKVIKANSQNTIKSATEMEYNIHSNYQIGEIENKIADSSSKITLKETENSVKLEVSQQEFSTMRVNENIEMRVILQSNNEKYSLYKNPNIKITFPQEFEKIDITSIKLLNEDELQIKDAKMQGNVMNIELSGEQTSYKEEAIEGTTILMTANLTTNKKQKNFDGQIVVDYTNGKATGNVAKDIKIVSYAGLITTNSIKEYNIETINNEGTKNGKLELGKEAKNATVTTEIINNQEETITNVRILGTFPTKGAIEENTIDIKVGELNIEGIDTSKVKIYYSENANANSDLNDNTNSWKETILDNADVKKYLVQIDNLTPSEDMYITYGIVIPERLEYNEIASEKYMVYYTDSTTVEQNIDNEKLTLETGKGPEVQASLKAKIGDGELDTAKEGEKVQYEITAKNTGSEKVENLTLIGKVPEGTIYLEELKPATDLDGTVADTRKFAEIDDKKEVTFTGITLEPGQEITKTYMVKINKETANRKNISNSVEIDYGEVKKQTNTVTTKVLQGNIEIAISAAEAQEELVAGYEYRYFATVQNLTNKDIKNIKLQINTENLSVKQILYTDNDELKKAENTNEIKINKLLAGSKFEMSIYTVADMFKDTESKTAKINVTAKVDDTQYHSNSKTMKSIAQLLNISNTSENSGQYVKQGDKITYKINVTNNGENAVNSVNVEDQLSQYETLISVQSDNIELSEDQYELDKDIEKDGTYLRIQDGLSAKQSKTYTVTSEVNADVDNEQALEIGNTAKVYAYSVETAKAEVMHILEPAKEITENNGDISNPGNTEGNTNQNANTNNQNSSEQNNTENNKQNLKMISGIAWLDKDGNGQKDEDETLLKDIKVKLFNTEKNQYQTNAKNEEITATTNADGFYTLSDVPEGKYIVVFEYDTTKYCLTSYEKEGTTSEKNSKVVSKEMTVEGTQKEVGITEEVKIKDSHISYMNIGLKERKIYDMKLEKMVSRVVVQNAKETRAVEYPDSTLAKVDLDAKQLGNTNVVVEYKIRVTNEGEVAGYIKKIEDYISADYKFSSELNKDWYQSENKLYNNSLATIKLEPGQSKEIKLILTKQMTENNTGLINNTAEIVESYNEQGIKDIDSTEGNRAKGEDDLGSADLILSIKTGQVVTTVLIILSTIAIIGVAAYIIAKKVINKEVL